MTQSEKFMKSMSEVYSNLQTPNYKALVADSNGVKAVEYAQQIQLNGLATVSKLSVNELIQIIKADHFKDENFAQALNLYKKVKNTYPKLSTENLVKIQHECQYKAMLHGTDFNIVIKFSNCEDLQSFIGSSHSFFGDL